VGIYNFNAGSPNNAKHNLFTDELEAFFADITITRYIYESKNFFLGGKTIPAMTGSCDIIINSNGEQLKKIKLLLGYATYSGIGAKTSLGMGGFLVRG